MSWDIKLLDSKEIYWARTIQQTILINGKEYSIRIVETTNGTELWILHDEWQEIIESSPLGKSIWNWYMDGGSLE